MFSFGLRVLIKRVSFARLKVVLSEYILENEKKKQKKKTYFGVIAFAQLAICSLTLSILVLGPRICWLCYGGSLSQSVTRFANIFLLTAPAFNHVQLNLCKRATFETDFK